MKQELILKDALLIIIFNSICWKYSNILWKIYERSLDVNASWIFLLFIDYLKYEIFKSCDNYYYIVALGYNNCIDNCKLINYYFYKENKKCENSCSQFEDPIGYRINYCIE